METHLKSQVKEMPKTLLNDSQVVDLVLDSSYKKNIYDEVEGYLVNNSLKNTTKTQKDNLVQIVLDTLEFNRHLPIQRHFPEVDVVRSAYEILETMALRSSVYNEVGFTQELDDPVEGLNFHPYDKNSVLLNYRDTETGEAIGTMSLIVDSKLGFPSETLFDKNQYNDSPKLAEITRLAIKPEIRGKNNNRVFKRLYGGVHSLASYLNIDHIIMTSYKTLSRRYLGFGGMDELNKLESYGKLDREEVWVLGWNPNKVSDFFKKNYLPEKTILAEVN